MKQQCDGVVNLKIYLHSSLLSATSHSRGSEWGRKDHRVLERSLHLCLRWPVPPPPLTPDDSYQAAAEIHNNPTCAHLRCEAKRPPACRGTCSTGGSHRLNAWTDRLSGLIIITSAVMQMSAVSTDARRFSADTACSFGSGNCRVFFKHLRVQLRRCVVTRAWKSRGLAGPITQQGTTSSPIDVWLSQMLPVSRAYTCVYIHTHILYTQLNQHCQLLDTADAIRRPLHQDWVWVPWYKYSTRNVPPR